MRLTKIRQQFERNGLRDPLSVLREQLARLDERIPPGARIGVGVGSRGIGNLHRSPERSSRTSKDAARRHLSSRPWGVTVARPLKGRSKCSPPMVLPKQPSARPCAPRWKRSSCRRETCRSAVFMDRHAHESDGVILINRIKPHSDFHGRYESGLMKMALIGLGKQDGALAIHRFGVAGLRELIGPGARRVLVRRQDSRRRRDSSRTPITTQWSSGC